MLISVPLFHVTGSTSLAVRNFVEVCHAKTKKTNQMMATMGGLKIVLMRKWDIQEGRAIKFPALLHLLTLH